MSNEAEPNEFSDALTLFFEALQSLTITTEAVTIAYQEVAQMMLEFARLIQESSAA